jgi:ppGpp synthetase/RelA/SpoT-type nucleotidyltranferase
MDKSQLKELYDTSKFSFNRLKENLEDALKIFLDDINIPYLAVYGRVKSFESFYEKIATKNYSDPFKQTEDFVGIRIILYFPNDIDSVEKLINEKFLVEQSENKSDKLEINEFGYRSHHCIIKVVRNWCETPNYRGLEDYKSEVQIRTVLMHAWAEIEHKLQYKSKEQVPKELQRKLFLLSAKLEEADQQFEDIKNKSLEYQESILERVRLEGVFDKSIELNLDTFRQFLIHYYPECTPHEMMEKDLFNKILEKKIDYSVLVDIADKFKPFEPELLEHLRGSTRSNIFSYAISAVKSGILKDSHASNSRKALIQRFRKLVKENV